jgi:predicted Zn-dependent peptidase
VTPGKLWALTYESPEFYDTERYSLKNGMRVLLNHREHANNASIRLQVYYGMYDEPCGKKELPHFLEHLLFTGTTKYTESELEDLVEEMGAGWNAGTVDEYTYYEMDTNSLNFREGLELLHHITTDSTITEENVNTSRDIIHRESGLGVGELTQWLWSKGYDSLGMDQFAKSLDINCAYPELANDIQREDILAAYSNWYKPNNMRLILVGNLPKDVKPLVEHTFGDMTEDNLEERYELPQIQLSQQKEWRSSVKPLKGDQSELYLLSLWLTPEYYWERTMLNILQDYLKKEMYEGLRIETGLAYSPSAFTERDRYYAGIGVFADVDTVDIEAAKNLMDEIWVDFAVSGIPKERFEKLKKNQLLALARNGIENETFADWYLEYEDKDIDPKTGQYRADEAIVLSISHDQVQAYIKQHVQLDPYFIEERPTFTNIQFWLFLGGFPFLSFCIIAWYFRKKASPVL